MKLDYALVRRPSPIMDKGQLTHLKHREMSPELALEQWKTYCNILSRYTQVVEVEATPELPDSVFVEDTVFTYANIAVRTNMHPTRVKEQDSLVAVLEQRGFTIVDLPEEARLEGGDILKFADKVWVGQSTRTNAAGLDALRATLHPLGVEVVGVPVDHALHLKSVPHGASRWNIHLSQGLRSPSSSLSWPALCA